MDPASNQTRTSYYSYEDTKEFRNQIRKSHPTCIVNVRKLTSKQRGETCFSKINWSQFSCSEALNTTWPNGPQIKYLGQLCRIDSEGNRICTAFQEVTNPAFQKFLRRNFFRIEVGFPGRI